MQLLLIPKNRTVPWAGDIATTDSMQRRQSSPLPSLSIISICVLSQNAVTWTDDATINSSIPVKKP